VYGGLKQPRALPSFQLRQQLPRFRPREPSSHHRLWHLLLGLAIKLGLRSPGVATCPPQIGATSAPFPGCYLGKSEPGGSDATDLSSVYGALLIAIWIGVMGIVVAVLDSPEMLIAGGLVAAILTVALAQEFVEWRSRPRTTKSSLEQRSI
jgi:hypothetical protein